MKRFCIALAISLSVSATSAPASEEEPDIITFAAKHPIPATLTLYSANGNPAGRHTPIFDNYRPNVRFGGGDVNCAIHLPPPVTTVAPGETAAVFLSCQESISVSASGSRFVIREGGWEVGFGIAHGSSPSSMR